MSNFNIRTELVVKKSLKDFKKKLNKVAYTKVGVMGEAAHKKTSNNVTVIDYAVAHEFGSPVNDIPQRSFIERPLKENLPAYLRENEDNIKKYVMNGMQEKALNFIGIEAKNIILEAFENGGTANYKWEPLQPATIARKGSTAILIDEGNLQQSIMYKVETHE